MGITNQRETVVAWDERTGAPLHRAIVWQDRRTAARCDELRAQGLEPLVRQRTGLVIDPYFSGTKIEWLLRARSRPARARRRGRLRFGTIDAWLSFKLTGRAATDCTNASRTLLFDIHALSWDEELCDLLGVRRQRCRSRARRRQRSATPTRTPSSAPGAGRGHGGRPAGRAVRPGLPRRPASARTRTAPAASC